MTENARYTALLSRITPDASGRAFSGYVPDPKDGFIVRTPGITEIAPLLPGAVPCDPDGGKSPSPGVTRGALLGRTPAARRNRVNAPVLADAARRRASVPVTDTDADAEPLRYFYRADGMRMADYGNGYTVPAPLYRSALYAPGTDPLDA